MPDILHRVGATAPIEKVYDAIATPAGVGAWWTKETSGDAVQGGTLTVRFANAETGDEVGGFDLALEELVPSSRVAWRVLGGAPEWTGTLIAFDLKTEGEYTVVEFAHEGWAEPGEFMAHCTTKWATFLMSLKQLVETGSGEPAPHDVRISDWH